MTLFTTIKKTPLLTTKTLLHVYYTTTQPSIYYKIILFFSNFCQIQPSKQMGKIDVPTCSNSQQSTTKTAMAIVASIIAFFPLPLILNKLIMPRSTIPVVGQSHPGLSVPNPASWMVLWHKIRNTMADPTTR